MRTLAVSVETILASLLLIDGVAVAGGKRHPPGDDDEVEKLKKSKLFAFTGCTVLEFRTQLARISCQLSRTLQFSFSTR